jgi:hypothetical protein
MELLVLYSLLVGVKIIILNFLLDPAVLEVIPQQDFINYLIISIVLVAYPLAILWSFIGGWDGSLKL